MKNIFKTLQKNNAFYLLILTIFLLPIFVVGWGTYSLQYWDLVDSGKHMDYKENSKYAVTSGIGKWNTYKPGVIREDTLFTINDVTYSDVASLGTDVVGQTSENKTIKFATQYMDILNSTQRLNVIIHETGHGLRLDHRGESDSVMQSFVTNVTTLSTGDKNNYSYAYDNFY